MTLDRRLLPVVEAATVLLTLSVIIGFRRLFDGDGYMPELILVALVTHAASILLRRAGRGLAVTALTTAGVGAAVVTAQHYRESATAVFIPSSHTRELLRADLQVAWDSFGEVAAPTEPLVGFVVFASLGVWLCAFLVDWAAFRLGSKIETLLPVTALFGFQAIVGGDRARISATAIFGATALFFVLAHRVAGLERDGRWLCGDGAGGHVALLRGGGAAAGTAVLLGLVVGPLLPGADDEPLVELDPSNSGDGVRWVENPLVDIRAKLFDQSDAVMFTVTTSAEPDYWRMMSLHEFDGEQWSTSDNYVDADAELASGLPGAVATERMEQIISPVNLVSNWLPAAYEPREVVAADFVPNWSPDTGALLMPRDRPLERGDTYRVVSELPSRDIAAIATAADVIPDDIAEQQLALPGNFSARVRDEANAVVARAGAVTPYEKALALQNYFARGAFGYDIDVAAGHSNTDMEDFLFDVRVGYCEQFAGSYAAMARAIGLPARVAVGFTPGSFNPERGWYEVRGTDAHAWPEVWFPEAGWVRFEPTPNRGASRDQAVTGIEPMAIEEIVSDPSDTEGVTVPTTTPTPTVTAPTPAAPPAAAASSPLSTGLVTSTDRTWILVAALVLAIGVVAAMARARHRHEKLRYRADVPVRLQVDRAWDAAVDSLAMTGTPAERFETAHEFSRRAGGRVAPDTAAELAELATITTVARYSGDDLDPERGNRARQLSRGIRGYCRSQVPRRRRVLWDLDPRPMMRPRR